ncbi:MAG: nucleoside diphosphate kinase regulator [Candidatus Hydrogenedentes bacterium]|nr:nucleoside diphosphate kinase regulator [Candidatus Hydrogenedentota bacterium]
MNQYTSCAQDRATLGRRSAVKEVYVTAHDYRRLSELVNVAREFGRENERYLKVLESELNQAHVVDSEDIPADVITMNSKARLRDCSTGSEMTYTLVFPSDSDPARRRVSVLAPIGTAMLGNRVGEAFEWEAPRGPRRLKVEAILYQPEAAGHFAL